MVNRVLKFIRNKEKVKVSEVLDLIIPFINEQDFILKKSYKVKESIDSNYGKWPNTYGNAYFLDSKFLLQDVMDMFKSNTQ